LLHVSCSSSKRHLPAAVFAVAAVVACAVVAALAAVVSAVVACAVVAASTVAVMAIVEASVKLAPGNAETSVNAALAIGPVQAEAPARARVAG